MSQNQIDITQNAFIPQQKLSLAATIAASITEMLRPHFEWLRKYADLRNNEEDFQRHFTYYIALSDWKLEKLDANLNRIKSSHFRVALSNYIRNLASPRELFGFVEIGRPIFPPSSLSPIFERILASLPIFFETIDPANSIVTPTVDDLYKYPSEHIRECGARGRGEALTKHECIALDELNAICARAFHAHFYNIECEWYVLNGVGIGTSERSNIMQSIEEHKEEFKRMLENHVKHWHPSELASGKLLSIGDEIRKMNEARKSVEDRNAESVPLRKLIKPIQNYSGSERTLVDLSLALEEFLYAAISVEELRELAPGPNSEIPLDLYERILGVAAWFMKDIRPVAASIRTSVPWA